MTPRTKQSVYRDRRFDYLDRFKSFVRKRGCRVFAKDGLCSLVEKSDSKNVLYSFPVTEDCEAIVRNVVVSYLLTDLNGQTIQEWSLQLKSLSNSEIVGHFKDVGTPERTTEVI
jgi:hypothetical protein